jgi:hypothetical protein
VERGLWVFVAIRWGDYTAAEPRSRVRIRIASSNRHNKHFPIPDLSRSRRFDDNPDRFLHPIVWNDFGSATLAGYLIKSRTRNNSNSGRSLGTRIPTEMRPSSSARSCDRESISTYPYYRRMQRVTVPFRYDESWSPALATANAVGTAVRVTGSTQHPTGVRRAIRSSLLLNCRALRLLRSVSQVRNSFSDSCDVTVKTGADLAKTRESQVTFAAFNSTKITSV